ncbi:46024_t:CDS:2 [Gigaspora margarita]|uniref:46024_t:CDS:1 n=1 Tax=Gigaspora margarita TaxID=4874 RepID=A0ABN7UFW8_GIGMA|nr:46024_t:CDS:2 [Gigaspora margarita]
MTSSGQSLKKLPQAHLAKLKREIIELRNDPLKGINVIIHYDITSMGLILTPLQGPFFGLRLHLSVNIPEEYPRIASKVSIQTAVEHPNVFSSDNHNDSGYICADILTDKNRSSRRYNGDILPGTTDNSKILLFQVQIFTATIIPSSSSLTNINDASRHLSDIMVNELTDDAWLHIIEFLTDQEIFLLSEAYPRISTLVRHFNILLRRQLLCYYLRKTFNEAILGIGLSKCKLTIEAFDLFSYEVFNEHNLRDGI